MNKRRRERVRQAVAQLTAVREELSDVLLEEDMALDGVPENLQSSQRYMDMEDAVDTLNEAIDDIDSAIDGLEDI